MKIIQIAIDTGENERAIVGLSDEGDLYLESTDADGRPIWILYLENIGGKK